jgi:hypothetical protein
MRIAQVASVTLEALTQQLEDARREREVLESDLDEVMGEIGWLRSELHLLEHRTVPARRGWFASLFRFVGMNRVQS